MSDSFSVTVGVFSFNQAKFIDRALNSINELSGVAFDLVIFDDFSTDESQKKILEYKFSNPNILTIRYQLNKKNLGLANNLNKFVASVKTTWILLLAADDFFNPNSLEIYYRCATNQVDVIWGDLNLVSEEEIDLGKIRPKETWQSAIANKFLSPKVPMNAFIYWNNFVPGGMTLIRKSVVANVGGWIPNVQTEDLGLWLKIRQIAKFMYVPEIVGNYRNVEGSASKRDYLNIHDQAAMCRELMKLNMLSKFQSAVILDVRIIYTIIKQKKMQNIDLFRVLNISGVSVAQMLLAFPFSVVMPLYGLLTSKKQFNYESLK